MSGIAHSEIVVIERFDSLALETSLALGDKPRPEFSLPPVLTLQRLLSLSLTERQQIMSGCLPGIIADFDRHPELREFESDISDWELGDD
jgi:hypothetical protein